MYKYSVKHFKVSACAFIGIRKSVSSTRPSGMFTTALGRVPRHNYCQYHVSGVKMLLMSSKIFLFWAIITGNLGLLGAWDH